MSDHIKIVHRAKRPLHCIHEPMPKATRSNVALGTGRPGLRPGSELGKKFPHLVCYDRVFNESAIPTNQPEGRESENVQQHRGSGLSASLNASP